MAAVGDRIKQVRRRYKLSQRDLGERLGVSHTAISKYERGLMNPDSSILLKISEELDLDVSFFLRPARVQEITPAYRKLSRLKRSSEKQLIERIRDWLERYLETEEIVRVKPLEFEMPSGFPRTITSMDQIEEATSDLRSVWELGQDPIEDMTAVLEERGIRVGQVDAADAFDACTFETEVNGRIPVIVTRNGLPGDRQRFNLAHELGHLLLEVGDDLDEEKACHRFAGALLAPAPIVHEVAGETQRKHITLDELHLLKHKFGLSMQALIFRLRDLGIVSHTAAKGAHRTFRQKGWHREEPGDQVDEERPERFHLLVLRAWSEELISERRARELYDGPIAELEPDVQLVS